MRRATWILWLPFLVLLAGCDEDARKDDAAPRAAQPAPYESPVVQSAPAAELKPASQEVLKDAVGAAPSDDGRVTFDGAKALPNASTGAGSVLAQAGSEAARRSAQALINAPAPKQTLKINEPPAPVSDDRALAVRNGLTADAVGDHAATPVTAALSKTAVPSAGSSKPRILYLGDSLSTRYFGLGPAMYEALSQGHPESSVQMYAYGGSSPSWFLPNVRRIGMGNAYTPGAPNAGPTAPKLPEILSPDVKAVLVEQGTNMIDWTALKNGRPGGIWGLTAATEMAKTIGATTKNCLWIGPPDMKGLRGSDPAMVATAISGADAALAKAVAPYCVYIKSSDKTKYVGGDGIHQNADAGRAWAKALLADPAFKIP